MIAVSAAAAGSGGRALWYLTRSTGIVALVLLTATVVIGVVASVGWTTVRWPRFLSQSVHRNLSLLCVAFVALHVVTTVTDGYVPITYLDAVLPLGSPYRPVWVGLGALAFDLLVAVLITSALRRRIGYSSWRFVHWLAYLCWPIAMFHALGTGSDAGLPFVLLIEVGCGALVLAAVIWRAVTGRQFEVTRRVAAVAGAAVLAVTLAGFAAWGPLRPGWSHRSGTSAALLASLARKTSTGAAAPAATTPTTGPTTGPGSGTVAHPVAPFRYQASGTQSETGPDQQGNARVDIALHLDDPASTALDVTLVGAALPGGGIVLSSGTVQFGGVQGSVTGLDGPTIRATLPAPTSEVLTITLAEGATAAQLSGTVSGTAPTAAGGTR